MQAPHRPMRVAWPKVRDVVRPLFAIALLLCAACRGPKTQGKGCVEDKDCTGQMPGSPASAWKCEPKTGVCYCRTNEACLSTEFCNTAGFCQDKTGCEKNADCVGDNLFCDTTTGTCLTKGRCSTDLHCPLGQVCDVARSICVDGCRTNGDCPGSSCRCGDRPCACTGKTQAELQACAIGECDPTFCADDTFCKFGELCGIPPDAGVARNVCYSDYDPVTWPYCARCTWGGGVDTCGRGANYCLIDTQNPGNYYCGADCSEGQACPRGFACSDVIVVFSRWQYTSDSQCPPDPSLRCARDEDCRRGGTCVKPAGQATGHCAAKCRIREGAQSGFYSCQVDSDCAQETCSAGECSISRKKCVVDTDCRPIRCVDFRGAGGCLIGQNCTPANGLTCLEVQ